MTFETALNVIWLLLGCVAFANAVRVFVGRNSARKQLKWFHVVGIALILAALFPYISATDDILRVENYASQKGHPHSKSTPTDNLVRLYATADSPLVCKFATLAFTFVFLAFVFLPVVTVVERSSPFQIGRSPPVLATL